MEKNSILIVAAHPDDEILGVGGTAIEHVKQGDGVFCLILGEGITSRENYKEKEIEELHKQSQEAGKIIGFKEIFFSKFPDNKFDSVPLLDIIKEIEKYLEKIKPDIVYTHHGGDLNIDHQVTFKAVITACRPANSNCPSKIYTFETPSSTEWQRENGQIFNPGTFINIEKELEQKIKALKEYKLEIREFPHPRSEEGIRTLAKYRGLQSNFKAAEAFCLVKEIKND